MHQEPSILEQLMAVIEDRKKNPPDRSYTAQLLAGGVASIGAKISEETDEVLEASAESGPDAHGHLVHEAADLLYHLCVMLGYRDITWHEVESELGRRFGICGLDEKEARNE